MAPDANPGDTDEVPVGEDDPDDADALATHAAALADGIEGAVADWVERSVERLLIAYRGRVEPEERVAASAAGTAAAADIGPAVRALLATDIDEQRNGPLALARRAVRYPTVVLRAAGVPAVERDEFVERQFPDDVYDLAPATFADLDPALHELGINWGAAKAHTHLVRRRREGLR
jgi:hypothetical protein